MSFHRDPGGSPWLDAETRAILDPAPPEEYVALGVSGFTLVLLERGFQVDRLVRAFQRIQLDRGRIADSLLFAPCPAVVRSGLTLDQAIVGQFELVCCDCISVFLRDEIAAEGATEYLRSIYSRLRGSPEFQPVFIAITLVPDTDAGRRFCDQFLSTALEKRVRHGSEGIVRDRVFRKKARMMAHWASETGVQLAVEE